MNNRQDAMVDQAYRILADHIHGTNGARLTLGRQEGIIKAMLAFRDAALDQAARVAREKYKGHGYQLGTMRARDYEHAGRMIADAIEDLRSPSKAGADG